MNRPRSSTAAAQSDDFHSGLAAGDRRSLNLGVLAHVDAGKTSLTEALLFAGGALDRVGRVDAGTTQTDSMTLERRRGITIRTAVATFQLNGVTVNLVDTPGHPDFIAEVDRSLAVLDAAVLVVSAVEGVQAQTVVLYRALQRLEVPAVFFVNKIDRTGADPDRIVEEIRHRLTPAVVPLGTVDGPGAATAGFKPAQWDDPATATAVVAQLAEHDEALLADWVGRGEAGSTPELWDSLGRLTRLAAVHPVLFGSARTGAGVAELIDVLTDLLPPDPPPAETRPSGQVFKIERTSAGERICSVRMRAGCLAVRDRVELAPDRVGTVTALEVHEPGGPVGRLRTEAGQIARVHGLVAARIGDQFGSRLIPAGRSFPLPALQTLITARDRAQAGELHRALLELADIDPLIRLRPDRAGALRVSVYGAVQQEVLAQTLALDYGIEVDFEATTVICLERPAGRGAAIRRMGDPGHRMGYTLGVTVEPIPPGAGVEIEVTTDHRSLPLHVYGTVQAFRTALLGYLAGPLAAGPHGWQVTDVRITVTDSGYPPAGPSAADVRNTLAVVVAEALQRAGTVVCEPIDRFRVETPDHTMTNVFGLLARHRAVSDTPHSTDGVTIIGGTIPTAEVDAVRARLATAAHGEAVLESALDHHTPLHRSAG